MGDNASGDLCWAARPSCHFPGSHGVVDVHGADSRQSCGAALVRVSARTAAGTKAAWLVQWWAHRSTILRRNAHRPACRMLMPGFRLLVRAPVELSRPH
jgi:hypothetical protein